jgi:hypothetical protein
VVGLDKAHDRDVVQQTSRNDLFALAALSGQAGALQQVLNTALAEAQVEEVEERRLVGHPGKTRVRPLQHVLAWFERRPRHPLPRVDLAHAVQR